MLLQNHVLELSNGHKTLYLSLAILVGAIFLCVELFAPYFEGYMYLESLLFFGFAALTFSFFRLEIQHVSTINGLLEIIWKGFITSVVFFGLVFVIRTMDVWNMTAHYEAKDFVSALAYHLVGMSLIVFQGSIYYVFQRLTFYPKVKSILHYWKWFEYYLSAVLLIGVFFVEPPTYVLFFFLGVTMLLAIVATVRLKWVVYLDFKQKLQALFMVSSIFLMGLYFLQLFIGQDFKDKIPFVISSNLFIYCQFAFFGVYSLFTILILLFNLPTTGVFEKKFEEVQMFQLLSDTLQRGKDRGQILHLLLESCSTVSLADMGWIRYKDMKEASSSWLEKNTPETVRIKVEDYLKSAGSDSYVKEVMIRDVAVEVKAIRFLGTEASLLSIPIRTASFSAGYVMLIKSVKDGFDKDIINVLRMYTQQAAIQLENMSLLSEAIEKERYLEEIKISKRVQQSLLPKYNLSFDNLKISHFSRSTGTVGGDFFDYCTSNGLHYWVAIGDVAGKGTAAAFLMAQLKGIFRSLVQVCSGPRNLVVRTNYALSYSTEKNTFITLSVFLIDTEHKKIRHVRAGHCQAIYYSRKERSVFLLEPKGMGLGMVKDDTYKNYIEEDSFDYYEGDALFLYTDGVTEAKDPKGSMLEIDNLLRFAADNAEEDIETTLSNFETYFNNFCGKTEDDDDVTFMVIKFA